MTNAKHVIKYGLNLPIKHSLYNCCMLLIVRNLPFYFWVFFPSPILCKRIIIIVTDVSSENYRPTYVIAVKKINYFKMTFTKLRKCLFPISCLTHSIHCTGVGSGGGGKGGHVPPTFLTGGAIVCLCPSTFNPTFFFST